MDGIQDFMMGQGKNSSEKERQNVEGKAEAGKPEYKT